MTNILKVLLVFFAFIFIASLISSKAFACQFCGWFSNGQYICFYYDCYTGQYSSPYVSPYTTPATPPPVACPGSGVPGSGWGGSCSPGSAAQKLACDGPSHCSLAACQQYSGSTYCWYNNGTCYNDPAACNAVNPPCPQITCGGNPGAGGTCSYPSSPNVNIGSCSYFCSNIGQSVPGHTISVCQSNNCYANSCQCWPDNPCPTCPQITCGGNPGAGGVCSYPSSPNVNIGSCSYTCPGSTRTVAGHTISACQSNNCYANSCQCWPDSSTSCNNGQQKTTETCVSGQWAITNQVCVANGTCSTATPAPTPTPSPCNTGEVCGGCSVRCGPGTQSCYLSAHTSGGICNPSAPYNKQCNNACPNDQICNLSINRCENIYSVSGSVFVDLNGNGFKDAGEQNYTGPVTITSSSGGTQTGNYIINTIRDGPTMISYTNLPSGYRLTYPGGGPSFSVRVGTTCSTGGSNSAVCSNGSIANLNFGISNARPWIQCQGADCRIDAGFTSEVPTTAVGGPYANLNGSGGTPGLVFTGNSTPNFGQGQASTTNWVVGGSSYGETYSPTRVGGIVKTSYNYVLSKATQGNITPIDIAPFCSGGITNCTLTFGANSHGVYRANGDLTLNAFTFPNGQNFVILVNGNLTIRGRILVPNGSGSTALFSSSGNINIDKALGEASSSVSPTIQGIYSADKSFVAQGYGGCSIQPDLRLNIEGSVIVNGSLAGGSFQWNSRDLCADDISYPVVHFLERVDFILNTPDFLKNANFTYQEVGP